MWLRFSAAPSHDEREVAAEVGHFELPEPLKVLGRAAAVRQQHVDRRLILRRRMPRLQLYICACFCQVVLKAGLASIRA